MTGEVTLSDLLERCPYRSIIGPHGADLHRQRPSAVIVAPEAGLGDPEAHMLDQVLELLRAGRTVLVLAATAPDRERIRGLLGAIRPAQWGHA